MTRQHFYVTEGIDREVIRRTADNVRRLDVLRGREPQPATVHYHSARIACPGFTHEDFEVAE